MSDNGNDLDNLANNPGFRLCHKNPAGWIVHTYTVGTGARNDIYNTTVFYAGDLTPNSQNLGRFAAQKTRYSPTEALALHFDLLQKLD